MVRKKVIWILLLTLISLLLCVIIYYYYTAEVVQFENGVFESEKKKFNYKNKDLTSFIELYMKYTSPEVSKETTSIENQLAIFSIDCSIDTIHPEGNVKQSSKEFISDIQLIRQTIEYEEYLLEQVRYEIDDEFVKVNIKSFWDNPKDRLILTSKIVVKLVDGELKVVSAIREFSKPTDEEMFLYNLLMKSRTYNPEKGLGKRFLLGGSFSAVPSVTKDGRYVYFSSLRNSSSDIYKLDTYTNDLSQLTSSMHWDTDVILLPDENSILFYSDRLSNSGNYFICDIEGMNKRLWINHSVIHGSISFSQDGTYAIFIVKDNDNYSICRSNPDGSEFKILFTSPKLLYSPIFSHDQKNIYFSMEWFIETEGNKSRVVELFSINNNGAQLKVLTSDKNLKKCIVNSKANNCIFYTKENNAYKSEIWLFNLENLSDSPVFYKPNIEIWEPQSSVDGSFIFFVMDEKPFEYDIYSMDIRNDVNNFVFNRLTNTKGMIHGYSISFSGKWIIFVSEPKGAPNRGKGVLSLYESSTNKTTELIPNH